LFLLSPTPPLLRSTAKAGQAVSLTAAITPAVVGKLVPTGTVSFYNGTVLLGTAAPGGTLMRCEHRGSPFMVEGGVV